MAPQSDDLDDIEAPLSPRSRNSSKVAKHSEAQSNRHGALLLFLNFFAAISCIFVNKVLLKPPVSFRLPISITFVGYSSSVFGVEMCRYLGYLEKAIGDLDPVTGKPIPWKEWVRQQPWMLIITTAGAPLLANYSLLLNSVGVYQLSKVLVSPSILFFERLRGSPPLSFARTACLVVVSLGVAVVTAGDVSLNLPGMMVATLNILVAGSYKVEWGHTCRAQGISSLQLMSKVMPQATCILFLAAALIEGKQLMNYEFTSYTFWLLSMGGFTAFFTSWTGYMVIAELSAIAHQLLGQAKTCLILLAGALFFNSPLTMSQALGAIVAMSAMVLYAKLSMEVKTQHKDYSTMTLNKNEQNTNRIGLSYGGGGGDSRSRDENSHTSLQQRPRNRMRRQVSNGNNSNSAFII